MYEIWCYHISVGESGIFVWTNSESIFFFSLNEKFCNRKAFFPERNVGDIQQYKNMKWLLGRD